MQLGGDNGFFHSPLLLLSQDLLIVSCLLALSGVSILDTEPEGYDLPKFHPQRLTGQAGRTG